MREEQVLELQAIEQDDLLEIDELADDGVCWITCWKTCTVSNKLTP